MAQPAPAQPAHGQGLLRQIWEDGLSGLPGALALAQSCLPLELLAAGLLGARRQKMMSP